MKKQNGVLREENIVLRTQIAWLQNQLFGSGESEKLDRAQLLLKLGELEKLAAKLRLWKRLLTGAQRGEDAARVARGDFCQVARERDDYD